MTVITYRDAVTRGIAQEMRRDPSVVFLGEDVAAAGGVFKTTPGLLEQFQARHPRHAEIRDDGVGTLAGDRLQRRLRIRRGDHAKPCPLQRRADAVPQHFLVVNNQNGVHAASSMTH